jgi:hypothetical protein
MGNPFNKAENYKSVSVGPEIYKNVSDHTA